MLLKHNMVANWKGPLNEKFVTFYNFLSFPETDVDTFVGYAPGITLKAAFFHLALVDPNKLHLFIVLNYISESCQLFFYAQKVYPLRLLLIVNSALYFLLRSWFF